MNRTSYCRVCLADNVKMYTLISSPFQELYENLTDIKVLHHEGRSTSVCYLCHASLQQCYKLQQTALRSEAILSQLYLDSATVTDSKLSLFSRPLLHSYTTTTVEHINIYNERDRYTHGTKQEGVGECFDNGCIKEENGQEDHDVTNTQNLEPYECRQPSASIEVTLMPRITSQDSYETRQRNNLYLEIDGLKKSILQDLNPKNTHYQELTSDPEPLTSATNFKEFTLNSNRNLEESSSLNSKRFILDFDSTKNKASKICNKNSNLKSFNDNSEYGCKKCNSRSEDSRYDTKICDQNTKYIHYNQNLKLDNSLYDAQEFIAKKCNSRLLKMVYEPSIIRNPNLTSVSQNPNLTTNVSQNPNLTTNVSQNLNLTTNVSRNSNLTTNVSQNLNLTTIVSRNPNLTTNVSRNPNLTTNVSRNPNLTTNVSRNPNLTTNVSQSLNLTSKVSSIDNDESRLTDTQLESDSEDDLPLKMLRKKTAKKKIKDLKEQVSKREYRKALNIGASVVTVARADQLAALVARASSHNYLHSTYKCEYCYRGFLTEEVYRKHMEKHDETRGSYACSVCWLRYRSPRLLAAHARAAHERIYRCTLCNHTATTKNQAIDHQRIHNGDLFECKMCSKSFHARTTYLSHMRGRHPTAGASSVCSTCGDRFVSAQGLAMHQAKMHKHHGSGETSLVGDRGLVCVACRERFDNEQELDDHRNDKHRDVMTEDNARATTKHCSTCDIHFLSRRAYTRHMLSTPAHIQLAVHTKECPICLQTIIGPVRSHMRIHDRETKPRTTKPAHEEKLLHCDQCSQSFANKSRLNAHVRRVHLGLKYNKNLVCEVCGKKCTSAARLRYHQRTHTGERPYPCLAPACGARFADSNQLRIHTRTHTGERPYTCHTCGASFAQRPALNRHARVHTGVKPHTCDICNKSFTQSNSLNTHIKSVHLKMPRKLYSKTTCVRKTSQNTAETKKHGDLAVSVSGLTSNVTIVQGSEISDVTLVDSQVQSKITLGHP